MTEDIANDAIAKVLEALSNSSFKWRTLNGVAKETGLTLESVQEAIAQASDKIVRSSARSSDGRELFTTRENFKSQASIPESLLGAIINRAE